MQFHCKKKQIIGNQKPKIKLRIRIAKNELPNNVKPNI